MTAVIYARFSTEKQSDSSIEDQARNCVRYAERFGLSISRRFEDKAISGSSKNRPGFEAMRNAADQGQFDVLLVDDLSRLSRDDVEMKQVIRRFKFRGIRIIGVSDGYDSDTKGEKIQSTMRGLMNEIYLDDLREKTHRGMFGKALNGYSAGGRTYGYKRIPIESADKIGIDGRPEVIAVKRAVHDEEAKWVRKIFEWFANGESPKRIANKLNELSVPSARGSTWAASAIYGDFRDGTGMLNNPIYIGEYRWNRSEWSKDPDTGKRRKTKRETKDWVVTQLPELCIVPQQLWDAVQARQDAIRHRSAVIRQALNNPHTRSRSGKYLFSGLLECGCCGASYTVYSSTSYGCSTNINRGEFACSNSLRVSRKVLEDKLLESIKCDLLSEEAIKNFIEETTRILSEESRKPAEQLSQLKNDLKLAEKQVENIMTAIKAGILTASTKEELEKAEQRLQETKSEMQSFTATDELVTTALPNASLHYKALVKDLKKALDSDITYARECLRSLLGRVRLFPHAAGRFLEAELRHNPEGFTRVILANEFKARLVAGARFELTTFRL